ncbi:hypothetical protein ACWEN6_07245 [Sphaerisporangium sp. NPDC004334]
MSAENLLAIAAAWAWALPSFGSVWMEQVRTGRAKAAVRQVKPRVSVVRLSTMLLPLNQ